MDEFLESPEGQVARFTSSGELIAVEYNRESWGAVGHPKKEALRTWRSLLAKGWKRWD